jgi:dTDP-4-dehydrorhamnose 3,5-epimerase-like enzyme
VSQTYELIVKSDKWLLVVSIPGWAHNFINIRYVERIVMYWLNKNFYYSNPSIFF